jgi:hypothetical protein
VVVLRKPDLYEAAWQNPDAFLTELRDASSDAAALTLARIGTSGVSYPVRPDLVVPETAPRLFALLQKASRPLVFETLVSHLEAWVAKKRTPFDTLSGERTFKPDGSEYERVTYNKYDLNGVTRLAAGALGLWLWWLANEQGVKSPMAELPKKGSARLAAVGAELPYQESGPGKFLVMLAKGGRLPPYPPQGKSWGLVFGAKPRSIFALHPDGFVAATAFGLKSKLPVYWK